MRDLDDVSEFEAPIPDTDAIHRVVGVLDIYTTMAPGTLVSYIQYDYPKDDQYLLLDALDSTRRERLLVEMFQAPEFKTFINNLLDALHGSLEAVLDEEEAEEEEEEGEEYDE